MERESVFICQICDIYTVNSQGERQYFNIGSKLTSASSQNKQYFFLYRKFIVKVEEERALPSCCLLQLFSMSPWRPLSLPWRPWSNEVCCRRGHNWDLTRLSASFPTAWNICLLTSYYCISRKVLDGSVFAACSGKNAAELILFWGKFKQFLPNPEKGCAPPISFVFCVSSYSPLNSCFLGSVARYITSHLDKEARIFQTISKISTG